MQRGADVKPTRGRLDGSLRLLMLLTSLCAAGLAACASTPQQTDDFDELLERAEEGRSSAQVRVAYRYMTGRGVEPSRQHAVRWYTAAARQGDPDAIGALTDLGEPIPSIGPSVAMTVDADGKKRISAFDLEFGSYHALVIGNADYVHLPKLDTPVNDAQAVSALLRDQYGFAVTTLVDASWVEMREALASYRNTLTEGDNLLIYFAGHGWIDDKTEQAYWLPVDAERDNDIYYISNDTLATTLRGIEARHAMIVADSCFSGTLVRAAPKLRTSLSFIESLNEQRSRTAMTSGGIEPVVDSGANGHSVFANAFMAALEENQAVIDATGLFAQIRRPVMVSADQTPSYGDIRKAGHDNGDFLFVRVPEDAVAEDAIPMDASAR